MFLILFMFRRIRSIYILFKLFGESFSFAYESIKANKLRTFLSLLGITIGIFSIISVLTMVDALEDNVRSGIESLGSDVVYIEKWPWTPEENGEYKWWEFRQRPSMKYEYFTHLQNNASSVDAAAFVLTGRRNLKYKSNTTSRITFYGTTYDWEKISSFDIEDGRYFSQLEMSSGANVAIIGNVLATELFGDDPPIGKYFQIGGHRTRVIGVLKKQGKSILEFIDYDNTLMIPLNHARSIVNMRYAEPMIALKAKEGVNMEDLQGEIKTMMRSLRRLKPVQKDDFSVNEMSMISKQLNPIMDTIGIAGWLIGGLSILIGAFGVANIMFVSVKERTSIIGIQKALGAKNYFILTQFLFEAVLLTIMGGILGLLTVYAATTIISQGFDFPITLSIVNIMRGILISSIVGVLAGIVPAYVASRLNPVVAIGAK